MTKTLIKNVLGWGLFLWFVGYVLGFVFFAVLPPSYIGWAIMPIGTVLTVWVLMKKVKTSRLSDYVWIAVSWTIISIVADYLFIVKLLHPADGYYKPDVLVYYFLTFLIPIVIGWKKQR